MRAHESDTIQVTCSIIDIGKFEFEYLWEYIDTSNNVISTTVILLY